MDLGFGDAGKGLVTDALVRATGARLVVRYNGGAQAGHNVVAPDGRHHTFAQFGAGSFVDGVRTLLSREVVVHPTALLVEAAALAFKGVASPLARLGISADARVVTPFHQALGRLREIARGAARHGSCGVGIGEAVRDSLAHGDEVVRARDLGEVSRLAAGAARVCERLKAEVDALRLPPRAADVTGERRAFEDPGVPEAWAREASRVAACVLDEDALARWWEGSPAVVFEGAQGVLLDQDAGFHPYTTWSRCTPAGALDLIRTHLPAAEVETVGVVRSHMVRHGPGPLPTETDELRAAITDHNHHGPWQGPVRYGWFDAVLARYALDVAGRVDRLVVTHGDAIARAPRWRTCGAYALDSSEGVERRTQASIDGPVTRLAAASAPDLSQQEARTRLLERARPCLESVANDVETVVARIEALLDREVDLVGMGRRATDLLERRARAGRRPAPCSSEG